MKKTSAAILSVSALTLALACGGVGGADSGSDSGTGAKNGDGNGTGGDGLGGADGTGSTGNGSGTGSTGSGANGGEDYPDVSFEYDPSLDADPESCVSQSVGTDRLPVDMFIMLDRSGSMTRGYQLSNTNNTYGDNDSDGYCDVDQSGWEDINSRWCNSINALAGFLRAPSSVGLGVAFSEFNGNGPSGCGASGSMAVPFDVIESGDATGIVADVITELDDDNPSSSTPTMWAVRTLAARSSAWKADVANTRDVPIVAILITDGAPNSNNCDDNIGNINDEMVAHYADTGIPFYVIGMDGVSHANLEGLATGAGASVHSDFCIPGNSSCSYYSVGNGNPNTFIAALAEIQKAVMGCTFGIPSNGEGLVDLDTADVVFTEASGSTPETLSQVANLAACNSSSQYYVDGETIELCPDTCDRVGGDSSVTIDIKCAGQ